MKINPDKLTDFERQLATLFELHADKVSVGPADLQVPGLPRIEITLWGASVRPEASSYISTYTSTQYRELTWRGKLLARQLHRRAISRAVPEKSEVVAQKAEATKAPRPPLDPLQSPMNTRHAVDRMLDMYNYQFGGVRSPPSPL